MYLICKVCRLYMILVLGSEEFAVNISTDQVYNHCGARFCGADSEITKPSSDKVFILIMTYLPCIIISILLVLCFLDPLKRYGEGRKGSHAAKKTGISKLVLATLHQMRRRNQQLLIPITIFIGMEQAYIAAEFTQAFVACALGMDKIGFVMAVWGLVDSISCFVFGFMMKYIGRSMIIMFGATINICVIGFKLHWRPTPNTNLTFFLLAGLWGVGDAVWVTQINGLYGLLFRRNKEAAFSNYRFFEATGFVILFLLNGPLCLKPKLLLLYLLLAIGLIGYLTIEILYQNKTHLKWPRTSLIGFT